MTSRNRKSFFSIKTQFENLGDALINRELVKLVSNNSYSTVDLSRCPVAFQNTLALDEVPNCKTIYSSAQLFGSILKARISGEEAYWFLSPGGYFGEISWKQMISRTPNLLILYLMHFIGVKVCHIGVSYERLGSRHSFFLKMRNRLLYKHYTRDHVSKNYASSVGIKTNGVYPDLALNLFEENIANNNDKLKKISFCFRVDQYEKQEEQAFKFLAYLDQCIDKQVSFLFVVQVARDEPGIRRLTKLVKESTDREIEVVKCVDNLSACQAAYATSNLVIGNRLHGLLIGGSQVGKMIACIEGATNQKVNGLFQSLGLGEQIIRIDHPLTEHILEKIYNALNTPFDGRMYRSELEMGIEEIFSPKNR